MKKPVPFGKYLLLERVNVGGMAEVFKAKAFGVEGFERMVAVKRILPNIAEDAEFITMFIDEAKISVQLNHGNIAQVFDLGRHGDSYYIAMEYIGGRDLTQVLRRCQETNQRIPVPHAVYIAARIAEGLHFAHTLVDNDGRPLNIVNRDVSPSNVRLSYDGDVKLLDFGIAQALMKFTSEIGVLKGKFSYMSPEQIRGMPLDARTDVFSAGIILHEMLTTEKLFRGDTEFALMEKVRKAEVPPPSNFNRRVTPELDAIVQRALARDVADRFQSAAALAAELDALIAGYRFDPKELRQLMRQLFRKEYAKEMEDTAPVEPRVGTDPSRPGLVPGVASPTQPTSPSSRQIPASDSPPPPRQRLTGPKAAVAPPPTQPPPPVAVAPLPPLPIAPPPEPTPDADKPKGFWGSLFKKKR